mmetsp:Transcript_60283/g.132515  ORF Transcript_60283/g.132515 Transcript_60283/m.132515 type:complete len:224 (-) Transcript_60283:7-678(-)
MLIKLEDLDDSLQNVRVRPIAGALDVVADALPSPSKVMQRFDPLQELLIWLPFRRWRQERVLHLAPSFGRGRASGGGRGTGFAKWRASDHAIADATTANIPAKRLRSGWRGTGRRSAGRRRVGWRRARHRGGGAGRCRSPCGGLRLCWRHRSSSGVGGYSSGPCAISGLLLCSRPCQSAGGVIVLIGVLVGTHEAQHPLRWPGTSAARLPLARQPGCHAVGHP